MFIYSLK